MPRLGLLILLISLFTTEILAAEEPKPLLREDFASLTNWEPLLFPKIKRHTVYEIVSVDDDSKALQARSDNSASGLRLKKEFSIYDYPVLRWKWKISNVLEKGDATKKSGDDYPIRIYVNFKYDRKQSSFFEKIKYTAAKTIYGEYPPHSALNYIWSSKIHKQEVITSSYTSRAKLIVVDSGTNKLNQWRTHEVNVLEDYRGAFGEDPPAQASLAIMSDSDNTGEKSQALIAFIEIRSKSRDLETSK